MSSDAIFLANLVIASVGQPCCHVVTPATSSHCQLSLVGDFFRRVFQLVTPPLDLPPSAGSNPEDRNLIWPAVCSHAPSCTFIVVSHPKPLRHCHPRDSVFDHLSDHFFQCLDRWRLLSLILGSHIDFDHFFSSGSSLPTLPFFVSLSSVLFQLPRFQCSTVFGFKSVPFLFMINLVQCFMDSLANSSFATLTNSAKCLKCRTSFILSDDEYREYLQLNAARKISSSTNVDHIGNSTICLSYSLSIGSWYLDFGALDT